MKRPTPSKPFGSDIAIETSAHAASPMPSVRAATSAPDRSTAGNSTRYVMPKQRARRREFLQAIGRCRCRGTSAPRRSNSSRARSRQSPTPDSIQFAWPSGTRADRRIAIRSDPADDDRADGEDRDAGDRLTRRTEAASRSVAGIRGRAPEKAPRPEYGSSTPSPPARMPHTIAFPRRTVNDQAQRQKYSASA